MQYQPQWPHFCSTSYRSAATGADAILVHVIIWDQVLLHCRFYHKPFSLEFECTMYVYININCFIAVLTSVEYDEMTLVVISVEVSDGGHLFSLTLHLKLGSLRSLWDCVQLLKNLSYILYRKYTYIKYLLSNKLLFQIRTPDGI